MPIEFRISDTFTDSLSRLTGEEQKAVKTTAFDLQLNPTSPGMQFHKLEKARDRNFWSVRVTSDIRLIVHKSDEGLLLCYVDHHDKAYQGAERRKLEAHPKTGAAQLVEVRETVKEITIPRFVEAPRQSPSKPSLFAHLSSDELLGYGVPREWLEDVRAANEDSLLELADHLPGEAAEALLELATGGEPQVARELQVETAFGVASEPQRQGASIKFSGRRVPHEGVVDAHSFAHPDAQRRFRVLSNVEELARALDYPWEKWAIFLHPDQRQIVGRNANGPARVSGSAGTGKTVVALHRAAFLARSNPYARVLLTTFSEILANSLRTKLKRLISGEPRRGEQIEIHALDAVGLRLHELNIGKPKLASRRAVRELIAEASKAAGEHKFNLQFLLTEWEQVVDAWQLGTWKAYRDVARLGRKTRLPEKQRSMLWSIFEQVRKALASQHLMTRAQMFAQVAVHLKAAKSPPFEFIVVDESQDLSVSQLRFLAALSSDQPNALFFAGDLGQRIFQQAFSWRSLGVDIRGRSSTLRINYRTSHQIRMQADRLLASEISDVDGNVEERRGTISVFNGPAPEIVVLSSPEDEIEFVSKWLTDMMRKDVKAHEIGVFVRSEAELTRARKAMEKASVPYKVLDEHLEPAAGNVSISTMHLAKGLEFRAVVVMACDDEIIPLQPRIETVAEDSDLEEVYDTERHLLYVACTRARDHLLVTSGGSPSEFLDDLRLEPRRW